jgi:hypothetical protein
LIELDNIASGVKPTGYNVSLRSMTGVRVLLLEEMEKFMINVSRIISNERSVYASRPSVALGLAYTHFLVSFWREVIKSGGRASKSMVNLNILDIGKIDKHA